MRRILFAAMMLMMMACGDKAPEEPLPPSGPAASGVASDGPRVALVIGNARYDHANRLENPPRDARLVAQALEKAGFKTIGVETDLGVAAFRRALRNFRTQAQGAQVALVYYAGHGLEGAGRNWLIPTDARLASEYDLTDEAISLEQVMEALKGADLRVAILDACRDNPLGRSWARGTRAVARGLAAVEADDVLVIYAAAPGQTASDGKGSANSPFAASLARRLPEPGLAIQLLGGAVRDDVLGATNGAQRPFVSASITGTPFVLVPGDSETERLRRELDTVRKAAASVPAAAGVSPAPTVSVAAPSAAAAFVKAQTDDTWRAYAQFRTTYAGSPETQRAFAPMQRRLAQWVVEEDMLYDSYLAAREDIALREAPLPDSGVVTSVRAGSILRANIPPFALSTEGGKAAWVAFVVQRDSQRHLAFAPMRHLRDLTAAEEAAASNRAAAVTPVFFLKWPECPSPDTSVTREIIPARGYRGSFRYLVATNGTVPTAELIESIGNSPQLDRLLMDRFKALRCTPARRYDGEVMSFRMPSTEVVYNPGIGSLR